MGRRNLNWRDAGAIVEITATDGMTTHYGQITHYKVDVYSLRQALCCMANISPSGLCRTTVVNETQSSCSSWQLNDGGFDSQRYAIAQHQPLPAAFCRQVSLNRIVACVHSTGVTTNNAATLSVECGYSWFGMGKRLSVPKEIKNIMRDTGRRI